MTKNIKIAVGLIYILCLSLILYGFFIFIDVTQLNDYIYIRDKTQFLIEIRDQHLLLFTTLFFLFSILWSMKWDESVRMFPLYSAVPGSIFVLISLTHGYFKIKSGEDTLILTIEDSKTLIGMVKFLGFLTIIVVFSIILGQKIVLPIFIFLFCRYWASLSLKISIIYCFLGWSILVSFYEYVLTIFWYPSLIGDFINSLYANNHLLRLLF